MKKIGQIARSDLMTSSSPNDQINGDAVAIVNQLFRTFREIMPAFAQAWPTQRDYEGAKIQWVKAFMDSGLTNLDNIAEGVRKYRLLPTPFILSPGQFIEMCRPSSKAPYHKDYVQLTVLPASKEVSSKYLDEIKKILK